MRILISAGEVSGDIYGGRLAACLRSERPDVEIAGLGGSHMAEAGVTLLYPLVDLAVMGFAEVLQSLRDHKRVYDQTVSWAREHRPDAVVLIDYPGFNLRLGAALKRLGVRVYYFVSPQVWAWGRWRLPKMKRLLDHMFVILPFEEAFFREAGVPATFVGHPLVDESATEVSRTTALVNVGLDPARPVVGLLPGSRRGEIDQILPAQAEAVDRIRDARPDVQFCLVLAPGLSEGTVRGGLAGRDVRIVPGTDLGVRKALDVAITASGTATLVNAILEVPTVIVYRTSWLTYGIARMLARVDRIGLVNIIGEAHICPELIQGQMTAGNITREVLTLLDDESARQAMVSRLALVHRRLGEPGAVARTARLLLSMAAAEKTSL